MTIEIEDKFDVPADYAVPDLTGLRGASRVVGPKTYQLVAIYFDTADLRLAARGITLRRRRGGADPGWTLKLPKAKGARQEITHPLTRSLKIVPEPLADLVRAYTRGAELVPVAELDTRRSVILVEDADGGVAVEVADDRVKGTVLGEQPRVERWREVEAELVAGDPAMLQRVGKRLKKAGATPAGSASKLARLLDGAPRAAAPRPVAARPGSAGEVVLAYLYAQANAILAQDPQVRRAGDDAVHQMRVACRRMRSALKAFKSVVEDTSELQAELKWLGTELGGVRDLEVIRGRFGRLFDSLPPELVVGPARERLGADLHAKEQAGYDEIRRIMSSQRYFAFLDRVEGLITDPPLTRQADKPAAKPLAAIVRKQWTRVTDAYATAQAKADEAERETAMHDVRKAAKRARYTAEAVGRTELADLAERIQESLGTYQDGIVAQEILVKEADAARGAGEDTFTYGVLAGLERVAAQRAQERFPAVWEKTTAAVEKELDRH